MKLLNKCTIILIFACIILTGCPNASNTPTSPETNNPQNQSENTYTVDLNYFPDTNYANTAAFDKATKTITFKERDAKMDVGFPGLDISDYNIAKIKYKAIDGYGFFLGLHYDDSTLDWEDIATYCPSYINEMIIPLRSEQKTIKGIYFSPAWNVPSEKIEVESITFEKVSNPVKTDLYAGNEPPVIDTATGENIGDQISAWDYVKELGVGFQYFPLSAHQLDVPFDFGTDVYTLWSISKPSKEVIHFIKEKGFKTLRLQTAPEFFLLDGNYTISPQWMKLLKQVVDWAIEEDMYVIICGPFSEWFQRYEAFRKKAEEEDNFAGVTVTENYEEQSKALIKAVWSQYAAAFNNSYDEHLIFETLNEPIDAFHDHAWAPQTDCSVCIKDCEILNEYNQLIVNTIRESGGNNTKRFIMIEGLGASRWNIISTSLFNLPQDKTKDRLIPVVHLYPMGERTQYTSGIKNLITDCFSALDNAFFSKHIPVYFSEIGIETGTPILERINCLKDLMTEVTNDNRSCSVNMWASPHNDNGWGYYNNWTFEWYDTEFIDTLLYAAKGDEYSLKDDFIKANEVHFESIVGKNLLEAPVELKNWSNNPFKISSDTFYRSTPEEYKIEFEIERTGNNPELDFAYIDVQQNWHNADNTPLLANMLVEGGDLQGNIKAKSDIITISIDEELAKEIVENAWSVYLNGQDIIVKSMKVVE